MLIEILTIFPSYFDSPLAESLLGKAIAADAFAWTWSTCATSRRIVTARSTTSLTAAARGWS